MPRNQNNSHTIVYVMRHIDIGGHIEIPYKKIGITGGGNATLDSRLHQISNTKSPIKAQCIAAWEHHDAKEIEGALHALLDDSRIEGEWFLDADDTLIDRMHPIMKLLGANTLQIRESDDAYTKGVLEKEKTRKEEAVHILLGEVSNLLKHPLRSSSRIAGPTFFSDAKKLTYYVNWRRSGRHVLAIGRSKSIHDDVQKFIEGCGYDTETGTKGNVLVRDLTVKQIAALIDEIETSFESA